MAAPNQSEVFVENLLAWYETNGRHDFPWRADDATPFNVLIAELMLQQTSAGQVLNVYGDFVRKYPTPESILETPREELADDIESLGLRKRIRYFQEASERLVENYDSSVPDTRSELIELQGVGEYTAASVLAHAFDKDVVAVDTNVARILSRVFDRDCGDKPEASENWKLAEELLPSGRSSGYIHALIDFGAKVCTASDPSCKRCPLASLCEYSSEEPS